MPQNAGLNCAPDSRAGKRTPANGAPTNQRLTQGVSYNEMLRAPTCSLSNTAEKRYGFIFIVLVACPVVKQVFQLSFQICKLWIV